VCVRVCVWGGGGYNYVSYPAEDTGCSCTPIALICRCLWGEGVNGRGEVREHREVALDAYQGVKMAGARFWLPCKYERVSVDAIGLPPAPSALG